MITSRLTSKAQTTIPQTIRDLLGVGPGEDLAYRIEDGRVVLERAGVAERFTYQGSGDGGLAGAKRLSMEALYSIK